MTSIINSLYVEKESTVVVFQAVANERSRQEEKWGEQNHHDLYWLAILMEEVGELANAIIERKPLGHSLKEMVQVAAVAVAWQECRYRNLGKMEDLALIPDAKSAPLAEGGKE